MALSLATNVAILMVVFTILPALAVILRFHVRRSQPVKLAWDDWLIIPGLICAIGINATVLAGVFVANLGSHKTAATSPQTMIAFNKISFVVEVFNTPTSILVKTSILLFYRRLFQVKGRLFEVVIWALLVITWLRVAFFIATWFKCTPVQNSWLVSTAGRNGCYNYIPAYYASVYSNAITDFLILLVPIVPTWQMRLPAKKKVAVTCIFLLGVFTVVAAVLRAYFFVEVGRLIQQGLTDVTYYQAPVYYWTAIENSVAVVCACLPMTRQVFFSSSVGHKLRSWASWLSLTSSQSQREEGSAEPPLWEEKGRSSSAENAR